MRRGFTLIELSISICILIILFSISSVGYKSYRKYKDYMEKIQVLYEVEDFLSFSKCYSAKNKTVTTIGIGGNLNDNSWIMTLSNAGKIIKTINLGSVYKEITFRTKHNVTILHVDKNGIIDPVTILFKDGKTRGTNITVDGFSNIIRVKEGELEYNWQKGRGD